MRESFTLLPLLFVWASGGCHCRDVGATHGSVPAHLGHLGFAPWGGREMSLGMRSTWVTCEEVQASRCIGAGWGTVNFLHSSWMGRCYGFVLKAVLITQGCSAAAEQCLHIQGLFCFLFSSGNEEAGAAQDVRRGPGELTPTDPKGTACHIASCSALKAGARRRKGEGCLE